MEAYGLGPLDALFISHFDSDHVNGLAPLLDAFDGAEKVFLPYVHPAQRLFLAARELERGAFQAAGGRRSTEYNDYLAFLDDPAGWLIARGGRAGSVRGRPGCRRS